MKDKTWLLTGFIALGVLLSVQQAPDGPDGPAGAPAALYAAVKGPGTSSTAFIFPGLESRKSRRAFFSAPPVIPHAVGKGDRECLSCHATGREYKGYQSPLTPHPEYKNCQQCHVRAQPPAYVSRAKTKTKTDWQGWASPGKGTRQHPLAPPTIPHRLFLHDQCTACHHPDAVQTPKLARDHAQRTNCLQCHVLMFRHLDF